MLSRVATYYPSRFEKYVFLDIGYQAPGQLVTGTQVLADQDVLGYQTFFNMDGTGAILDQHVSSCMQRCSLRSGIVGGANQRIVFTARSKIPFGQLPTPATSLHIGQRILCRLVRWRHS